MIIEQSIFFKGLDFEKKEIKYAYGKRICYKGKDGSYYRIDHFGNSYVIEYAENDIDANNNRFEDADLYNDSLPMEELINLIQNDLMKYVEQ